MSENGYVPEVLDQPRMPRKPNLVLPAGSCDAHCHVFGPYDQYPLRAQSSYPPPDAPAIRYLRMLEIVGMQRGVLVQPAPYGTDVSAIRDAIALRPSMLKGIGVVSKDATEDMLRAMASEGFSGLRFVEARTPSGALFDGSVGFESIGGLAAGMRNAGLHIQMWGPYDSYDRHIEAVADLGIPVVIDHMASLVPARGIMDPTFQIILKLVRQGKLWIKLSLCRVSQQKDYNDVKPFHHALLDANEDRMLWGSDWPYVRMGNNAPDIANLLEVAWEWMGNEATRRKVLVDNPADLYRF